MSNLQILIEDIRTALSFPDSIKPDQMCMYARDYTEACTVLNQRMQQCMKHLRSGGGGSGGNIAEAIRLAEIKPNLPEMYLSLDFPEREEWCEVVSTLGFDVPPPLPAEPLEELNGAYLKISPMEPLLRWHRLYALNGSPKRERLAILRAIAKADPENFFWHEDQEKFEKVRIKELEKEIRDAIAAKDSAQIRALYNELNSPDWIIKPPDVLRQTICIHTLQGFVDTLLRHFDVYDYSQAVAIYGQIQQLLAANNMALPAEIERTIRPAVRWLNETQQQNQFQNVFLQRSEALQKALEEESPTSVLERLYYSLSTVASQAGTTIPAELEKHYRAQIRANELRRSRIILLTVISILCVCLLFGGVVGWGLFQQSKQQQINKILAGLQKIETEKRYEEISGTIKTIEENRPEIAQAPEVLAAIARLQSMLQADQKRADDFERYYSNATTALDPPNHPTLLELERIRITDLNKAEELVRSTQENTKFSELKRKFEFAHSARQNETDNAFSEKLKEISDEFNSIKNNSELSNEILSQIKDLVRRTEILVRQQEVSKSLKNQGQSVLDSIVKYQKDSNENLEQNQAFQKLIDSVPNCDSYQSALTSFVNKYPKHPAVSDIKEVLKELDAIKNVIISLQTLVNSYTKCVGDFDALQKESPELLKQFKNLSSRISGSAELLFSQGIFLEKLSQTMPLTSNSFRSTELLLKSLSQQELYPWIDTKTNSWYYLTQNPQESAESYYYVTTFVSEPKKLKTTDESLKNNPKLVGTQYQFAIAALKKIDGIKDDAVDVVCDLMESMLSVSGIDPILKCILLDAFISDFSKINPIFAANFGAYHSTLKKSGVDMYTNWMDVNARTTIQQRNLANAVLKRLPDIKEIVSKTKLEQKQFKENFKNNTSRFEWIGLLSKNKGTWSCQTKLSTISREGDIYILRLKADKTIAPTKIGYFSGTEIKLDSTGTSCLQGLPVFFKQ
ncbi:MAG: hypothetical protein LBQ50_04965 [Planctomycetaceae bacterium]|jgi:hypothetical protein|nr:hypothetical protein [Planctomycetaceae bacterium]